MLFGRTRECLPPCLGGIALLSVSLRRLDLMGQLESVWIDQGKNARRLSFDRDFIAQTIAAVRTHTKSRNRSVTISEMDLCAINKGGLAIIQQHTIRARSNKFFDHFSQAALFWRSQSEPEREYGCRHCNFELGKVEIESIRKRMWAACSAGSEVGRGERIAVGFSHPNAFS